MRSLRLVLGLLPFLQQGFALDAFDRTACQSPTSDPLQGCPDATLLVDSNASANSTCSNGNTYKTLQSAISSLPNDDSPQYILVLPGTYTEQVNVTRPGPLYLLGQTASTTEQSNNTVRLIYRSATAGTTNNTFDNVFTSTLIVAPTLNSSVTGAGPTGAPVPADTPFGNVDFRAYNIDFVNDYADASVGPSLALSVGYANVGFYYCGFYSYQDTIFVGKLANAYFYQNEIAGQTDFLYGFGTAWIQSSALKLRNCGGGITAWKGSNTTFENKYGVYIHDSNVLKANSSLNITGQCALGRPWNAQHRSLFANTYLDDSIRSSGYIEWSATDPRVNSNTTMAEYKSYGPGWNPAGRIASNVSIVFDDEQYAPYATVDEVFQFPFNGTFGNVGWIDTDP